MLWHVAVFFVHRFLDDFYPPGPFTCIFSKTSPDFFLCRPQNKIGHPAGSQVECPRNINRLKNNMTCGMMTCEMNNLEIE